MAVTFGFNILGAGASGKVKVGFSFSVGTTYSTTQEQKEKIGYEIYDDDGADRITTDIYYDKVYGTYLFITDEDLSQTSNPQENWTQ